MADELLELRHEAEEASDSLWFIGALEEIERTDITLSMRLHIRPTLFVQVFLGTKSDSLTQDKVRCGHRRAHTLALSSGTAAIDSESIKIWALQVLE